MLRINKSLLNWIDDLSGPFCVYETDHLFPPITWHFFFFWFTNSVGEGNGNPLQHSCLGKPMDRGAWWAIVHRVAKSRTRLSTHTHTHTHTHTTVQCVAQSNISLNNSSWLFYWSIVNLRCMSFRCIAKWFSFLCVYTYIYMVFQILFHYRLLQYLSIVLCALQ